MATTAGKLPARWVIHTVGPTYTPSEDRSELLAACFRESLKIADTLGALTVAFPAVSTGIYRYPLAEAAEIAVRGVRDTPTDVEIVRFVLFDAESYEAFTAAVQHSE